MEQVELGLDTFGDVTEGRDGALLSQAQVIRNVVNEAVLADELGIDFFGLGEHHRADYAVSAPEIVLAAIAAQTSRIRLGTAVTVLSSDDPVRLYEKFATLDAVAEGRAELILGRGSFTESFPLFGQKLEDYEILFEEKLELFAALLKAAPTSAPVAWAGTVRPPLEKQRVFPTAEAPLRAWVGVGGSPKSVVRAAHYDLPLMLAIIGGDPARFVPYIDLHRRAYQHLGRQPQSIGVHSPGHIAAIDAQAREELWPHFQRQNAKIGAERGWAPMTREAFEREADSGSIYVGSPETVARRIANTVRLLGLSRFDLKYSTNQMPHASLMHSIELYGRFVVPRVRELLAEEPALA